VNGADSNGMARLNADGSLDPTFPVAYEIRIGTRFVADDGTLYGQIGRENDSPFGRLNPDRTIDLFPPLDGFDDGRHLIVAQPDGRFLRVVHPNTDRLNTTMFRFLPDGALDGSFTPVHFEKVSESASAVVVEFTVLDDGKILAGGQWSQVNGKQPTTFFNQALVRLNPDGSIDETFDVSPYGKFTRVTRVQSIGNRILLSYHRRYFMIRHDGTIDPSFSYSSDSPALSSVAADRLGTVYGMSSGGTGRQHFRLAPDGSDESEIEITNHESPEGVIVAYTPHLDGMLITGASTRAIHGFDGLPVRNNIVRLRAWDQVPIVLADPKLGAALQKKLGLGREPVTVEMVKKLTELRLDNLGITDLRGLENAGQLQALSINNNHITDLTPLQDLPLMILSATNNLVREIPTFTTKQQRTVALDGNPLSDTAIANLNSVGHNVSFEPLLADDLFSDVAIIPTPVSRLDWVRLENGTLRPEFQPGVLIAWNTEAGNRYRIEQSTDLFEWQVSLEFGDFKENGQARQFSVPLTQEPLYFRVVERSE
jgi:Leucine-rich repeat (LRR) protein